MVGEPAADWPVTICHTTDMSSSSNTSSRSNQQQQWQLVKRISFDGMLILRLDDASQSTSRQCLFPGKPKLNPELYCYVMVGVYFVAISSPLAKKMLNPFSTQGHPSL